MTLMVFSLPWHIQIMECESVEQAREAAIAAAKKVWFSYPNIVPEVIFYTISGSSREELRKEVVCTSGS